jgi:hypothetical protein
VRHNEDNQLLLWWFLDSGTYMSPLSLKDILNFNLEIRQIYWKCLEMSEFSRVFLFFTWYVPFIYLTGNIERLSVSLAPLSCQNFRLVRQSKFYPKGPHMLCWWNWNSVFVLQILRVLCNSVETVDTSSLTSPVAWPQYFLQVNQIWNMYCKNTLVFLIL